MPFYEKWYRFWLFWMLTDGIHQAVVADPAWEGGPEAISMANAMLREALAGAIAAQAPDAPELVERITPAYPIGGKRMLRDNGVWIGHAEAAERRAGVRTDRADHADGDRHEGRQGARRST